jgi:hypothetical protein
MHGGAATEARWPRALHERAVDRTALRRTEAIGTHFGTKGTRIEAALEDTKGVDAGEPIGTGVKW